MINTNEVVSYNGEEMPIKDLPENIRPMYGYGHYSWDVKNRERHPGIGIYEPDECIRADEGLGTWINYGQNLVCPGCGLDYT
jgi:hypothetical protein